jgi:type I restriction enzyme R subunit
MSNILNKDLSEEDIKHRYITPALESKGWDKHLVRMEYSFTAGRIVVRGSIKKRKEGKKADYVLFTKENYPIAVVEAKNNNHPPTDGIQQAIDYATILDIPFAYSSNGDKFYEHDILTGKERMLEMDEFPTALELRERLKAFKNYSDEAQEIIDIPYYTNADSFEPRYYQRIAINRTIEAVANNQKRILLVMATGTGKTYTAFQIIHRLHASKSKKRILYLADRNILIDQTMRQDFKPFKKIMTKVQGKNPENGFEIYMSLYGQWVKYDLQDGEKQPYESLAPDFFDLIIVDECHRSSVREDSEWREILKYFESATQIGLTATPKAVDGANNIEYFGKPVYTYSLRQGIEDGFLAPYRVTKSFLNVDLEGYEPKKDEVDIYKNPLEDQVYTRNLIGRKLHINKRQVIVAKRITDKLKEIGPMTKTIVFCPDQEEADVMRQLLIEFNQQLVKKNPNYVVRITSDDRVGKKLLDDFIDPNSDYPVIATTSELLTTGVDCKTCGLIVIDKEVGSITTFKQMVGRGTRIYEGEGCNKMSFDILDFRNVTTLFNDPGFDGDPEPPSGGGGGTPGGGGGGGTPPPPPPGPHKYYVEGRRIKIVHEVVQYLGEDGKTLCTESVTDFTRKAIKNHYPTLDSFRGAWNGAKVKKSFIDDFEDLQILLDAVREENPDLQDKDEFDIICHVAFDGKPLTRKERVDGVKKRGYLNKYKGEALKIIEALMDKYAETGVLNIEDSNILELSPFNLIGKKAKIMKLFNGPTGYRAMLVELEQQLYISA